jgi:hypothetical protein
MFIAPGDALSRGSQRKKIASALASGVTVATAGAAFSPVTEGFDLLFCAAVT